MTSALQLTLTVTAAVVAVLAVTAAGVHLYGRDRLWQEIAGPIDPTPYDFDKPTRTGHPNDALACPADAPACALAAPEVTTPLFAVDATSLHAAVTKFVTALPRTTVLTDDTATGSLTAVTRSRIFGFPDTLALQTRSEGPGLSSLWVYSRSVVGHSDFGVNDRRVGRLVRRLAREVPVGVGM